MHFYPRSPCGERRAYESDSRVIDISIHALLAESDQRAVPDKGAGNISIHALLAESDITFAKIIMRL